MAIFSKRHYKAIACILASTRPPNSEAERFEQWLQVAQRAMADMGIDNCRFDKMKFQAAIGLVNYRSSY